MEKIKWRLIRIAVGILLMSLLGASIIFDIIFYLTNWFPNLIVRVIITFLILESFLRFTWFGKEFENFIKNKFSKK